MLKTVFYTSIAFLYCLGLFALQYNITHFTGDQVFVLWLTPLLTGLFGYFLAAGQPKKQPEIHY